MDPNTQEVDAGIVPAETENSCGSWKAASQIWRKAQDVLGGSGMGLGHRLFLTLSVIILITVAVALYAIVFCLSLAGGLIFGDALWVGAVADTLLAALLLGLVLPLAVSLGRLSCLMATSDGELVHGMAVSVSEVSPTELFYPFTSLRAYGRTMAVGMETLSYLACGIGIPVLAARLAWLSLLTAGQTPWLCGLAMAGVVFLGLCWGFGVLLLSGKRLGFSYFVFVHEEMSLGDVNCLYRTFRRPLGPALCLRVRLLGAYALSVVGICIPFVFYSIPMGLCCKAVYGRTLMQRQSEHTVR